MRLSGLSQVMCKCFPSMITQQAFETDDLAKFLSVLLIDQTLSSVANGISFARRNPGC